MNKADKESYLNAIVRVLEDSKVLYPYLLDQHEIHLLGHDLVSAVELVSEKEMRAINEQFSKTHLFEEQQLYTIYNETDERTFVSGTYTKMQGNLLIDTYRQTFPNMYYTTKKGKSIRIEEVKIVLMPVKD